jgi:hypothetical protein
MLRKRTAKNQQEVVKGRSVKIDSCEQPALLTELQFEQRDSIRNGTSPSHFTIWCHLANVWATNTRSITCRNFSADSANSLMTPVAGPIPP